MEHDKISVVREYCKARRIPYKVNREMLTINKEYCCYSIYNLPWTELFSTIDKMVYYNSDGFYIANKSAIYR